MVNKITKRSLKSFLYYDLWKALIACVLVCAVFLLAFNFVAKKPTDGQDFKILISGDVIMGNDANDLFEDLFTRKPTEGGFSYEMLRGDTMFMYGSEENPEDYLLRAVYGDLNYDDVVILLEELYVTYINSNMATDINVYIADAKKFVTENAMVNGEFSESKIHDYFNKTRKRDGRFRTKAEKEQGRRDEVERFKGLWLMANALEQCFKEHKDLLDKEREITRLGKKETGVYALNLGGLKGKDGKKITDLFSVDKVDEDGKIYYTADGVYLAIGNNKSENGDLYYEMLAVMYTLIKNYTNYL